MKQMICAFFVTIAAASLLTACNTVKGFGQDMQQGGQALQRSAAKNQS